MGSKATKNINAHPTFCCAGESDETDRLKYLFSLPAFGENADQKYNYFDELMNENDELMAVFQDHNIVWPSSVENFENDKFLENLTPDQAAAILKVLKI